jgi:hypothetical protein
MAAAKAGQRHHDQSDVATAPGPSGIRGWLLVLCALLLVYQPLSLAYVAPAILESLPIRGLPTALLLAARVLCVAVGIAAGIALVGRQRTGVHLARLALVGATATDLFIYATPYYPNYRMPGDTPFYVAASLLYGGIWLAYLARSKRVANTFE